MVANTFHETILENKVTCYNIGYRAMDEISWDAHSQIDFVLCPIDWHHVVQSIYSRRDIPLASHHFPVFVKMQCSITQCGT